MAAYIQTVLGPLDPEEVGLILPGEHPMRVLPDEDVWAAEILAFREIGGGCIVDITTPRASKGTGNGRDPEAMKRLSRRTGVGIVMGCGWYLEREYPPEDRISMRTVESLARQLVDEIEGGVAGTDVRPGIIGEFGVQNAWISPIEERVHRASGRAQARTGLPMNIHSHFGTGPDQLDLMREEGADPRKIVDGHCDNLPLLDYWLAILDRGAWVGIDNVGRSMGRHEERLVSLIVELVRRGFQGRILLSHDVGELDELRFHGGRGFTYLFEKFVPMMLDAGLTNDVVDEIVRENPRRFLSIGA